MGSVSPRGAARPRHPADAQPRKGAFQIGLQVASEGPRRMRHGSESLPECQGVGRLKAKMDAPSLHGQLSLHGDYPKLAKSTWPPAGAGTGRQTGEWVDRRQERAAQQSPASEQRSPAPLLPRSAPTVRPETEARGAPWRQPSGSCEARAQGECRLPL